MTLFVLFLVMVGFELVEICLFIKSHHQEPYQEPDEIPHLYALYNEAIDELNYFRHLFDSLPRCDGPITVVDGRITHGNCGAPATWWNTADSFCYCDKHVPMSHMQLDQYVPVPWHEVAYSQK